MLAGKRAKAARGELGMALPRGYVRQPCGEVARDPDEQVQATILLIFDAFERLGGINGVLQYLVRHHIALPSRVRSGLRKGDLKMASTQTGKPWPIYCITRSMQVLEVDTFSCSRPIQSVVNPSTPFITKL